MNKLIMLNKQEISNRINKSCMCCVYCGKSYKTRANIDKHLVLCETIYKSKNGKDLFAENEMEMPSQRQMYNIILELTMKCNKLEEKMELMSKWVDKKKKKINVIEWLNTNMNPALIFDDLSDRITIMHTDMETLLTGGFTETLNEILTRNVFDRQGMPLFCVDQKANYIYVYNKKPDIHIHSGTNIDTTNTTNATSYWMELERDNLIHFINKLHKKIIKQLTEWKKTVEKENNFDDTKCEMYNKTLMKVMNLNFKQDSTINKIKSIIYERMKTDMKSLIEYEFEF